MQMVRVFGENYVYTDIDFGVMFETPYMILLKVGKRRGRRAFGRLPAKASVGSLVGLWIVPGQVRDRKHKEKWGEIGVVMGLTIVSSSLRMDRCVLITLVVGLVRSKLQYRCYFVAFRVYIRPQLIHSCRFF